MNPNTPGSGSLNLDQVHPFEKRVDDANGGRRSLFETPKPSLESDEIRRIWQSNRDKLNQKYSRLAPPRKEGQ